MLNRMDMRQKLNKHTYARNRLHVHIETSVEKVGQRRPYGLSMSNYYIPFSSNIDPIDRDYMFFVQFEDWLKGWEDIGGNIKSTQLVADHYFLRNDKRNFSAES